MHDPLHIKNQTIYFHSAEQMDEIENETITLICTSPPYWNARDYGYNSQIGFKQSYDEYIKSLNRVWAECIRVLQPNGKMAINVQPLPIASSQSGYNRRIIKDIMYDIEDFMFTNDLFLSGMVYWDKSPYINNVSWGSYPKPTNIAVNTAFEQIFTFVKRGKTRKRNKILQEKSLLTKDEWRHWAVRMIWDDISPVIKINQKGENLFGHGAPFPEDIPYRLIRMHTIQDETVLDPFLGSGTTLKMCRLTNRKGIGYEINPDFKSLIEERIQENWTPPFIDSQYKTLSSKDITLIITESIKQTKKIVNKTLNNNDPKKGVDNNENELTNNTVNTILNLLKKRNIISDANERKIKENLDMV